MSLSSRLNFKLFGRFDPTITGYLVLLCCGLVIAIRPLPFWSRWASRFVLHRRSPDRASEHCNSGQGETSDSGQGELSDSGQEEPSDSGQVETSASAVKTAPQAEIGLEILYDDLNATIE